MVAYRPTLFNIGTLRKFDVGREVSYTPTHLDPKAKPQIGTLVSWNRWEVKIQFGKVVQVCNPHFVKFTIRKNAVGGRGNKVQ